MDLKMEVYSPYLELLGLLEIQNSVIWERKAFSSGSFSLTSLITEESKALLVRENIIWIAGEDAGIIEYIQEEAGEDGPYITVKGCDLTGALGRYILWGPYELSGPVPALMYQLVDDCCIHPSGEDASARVIPNLRLSDVPAGGTAIRSQKTGGSLLEALEALGEAYQVPFGVRFVPEVPCMEFWARPGANRSVHQTVNEPVFYSTELDDVLSSEYSYNAQNWRNVALVAGEGEGKDRVMVTVKVGTETSPTPPTPPTPTYTIRLSVDPEGGGVASGGGTVSEGQSVTVTATPSSGYEFAEWQENGQTVSIDAEYTFTANENRVLIAMFAVMAPKEYDYTGEPILVTLNAGRYKLEVWGAQGGYRSSASYAGKGGYSVGTLTLTERTNLFVRVGGSGNTSGFNGGGKRNSYPGGGGASDIRIGSDDVNHRVIVAGGGGSDGGTSKPGKYGGGLAGGDVGASSSANGYGTGGYGGTQNGNSGGSNWIAQEQSTSASDISDAYSGFGFGGNGVNKSGGFGGAGGGGWYGGTGRVPDGSGDDDGGGAGGSGFVWTGENAPDGFGLTEAYYLKDAETIDGSKVFDAPDGTSETGHSGNGYVRITPILPPKMYTINVVSGENGTASGGGVYEEGTQVTVTAVPSDGYKLNGWMENGESVSSQKKYTFTADRNRTLTAEFVEGIDSRLPEGYTEVEYIESSGTQYINTGIKPNATTKLSMDIEPLTSGSSTKKYFFRSAYIPTSGSRYVFNIAWDTSGISASMGSYGTVSYTTINNDTTPRRIFLQMDATSKTATADDVTVNFTSNAYRSSMSNINLLTSNTFSSSYTLSAKLYSCEIHNNGELVRDFVPCISPNGIVGMYDLATNAFYSNAGTGTFTAGPAV